MIKKEKRRQDYLFQLIKTLNPNERRYFKLYGNIQPGEKRYMRLFDALENKTEYDSEELCKELELSSSQLADEKYYLNQVLLRSLRNFDDEAHIAIGVYNAIAETRALFNRGLYDYALVQAEKVLTKINKLEMYSIALDAIALKQACLRRLSKFDELKKLDNEYALYRDRFTELFEMSQINYAITELEQKRGNADEAKKLFERPIFKKKPAGMRTFIVWFNLKCYAQILLHEDGVKWARFVRESVKYAAQNPQLLEINPLGYLYMYTDLASAEAEIGQNENAIVVIDKLLVLLEKPVPSAPKGEIESARLFSLYIKANALRRLKRYADACALAKKVYDIKHLRSVYDQFSFSFEYAIDLMHCGLPALALDVINELLQTNTEARSDYQQTLRILLIMVQIDMANYSLIPYLVKSTKIWFKRKKLINKEYDLFFKLAGNIAKAENEKLREKAFDELLTTANSNKLVVLNYELDIRGWTLLRKQKNTRN